MRIIINNIFLLVFILRAAFVSAADIEANVMIGLGGDSDLAPCDPWASRIESYITKRSEHYVGKYLSKTGSWSYENGGDRELAERQLSCAHCNRCRAYGFPYCYAMYYCNGCRRRKLSTTDRKLEISKKDIDKIKTNVSRACTLFLKKASQNKYPRAGLSDQCMAALAASSCKASVEEI